MSEEESASEEKSSLLSARNRTRTASRRRHVDGVLQDTRESDCSCEAGVLSPRHPDVLKENGDDKDGDPEVSGLRKDDFLGSPVPVATWMRRALPPPLVLVQVHPEVDKEGGTTKAVLAYAVAPGDGGGQEDRSSEDTSDGNRQWKQKASLPVPNSDPTESNGVLSGFSEPVALTAPVAMETKGGADRAALGAEGVRSGSLTGAPQCSEVTRSSAGVPAGHEGAALQLSDPEPETAASTRDTEASWQRPIDIPAAEGSSSSSSASGDEDEASWAVGRQGAASLKVDGEDGEPRKPEKRKKKKKTTTRWSSRKMKHFAEKLREKWRSSSRGLGVRGLEDGLQGRDPGTGERRAEREELADGAADGDEGAEPAVSHAAVRMQFSKATPTKAEDDRCSERDASLVPRVTPAASFTCRPPACTKETATTGTPPDPKPDGRHPEETPCVDRSPGAEVSRPRVPSERQEHVLSVAGDLGRRLYCARTEIGDSDGDSDVYDSLVSYIEEEEEDVDGRAVGDAALDFSCIGPEPVLDSSATLSRVRLSRQLGRRSPSKRSTELREPPPDKSTYWMFRDSTEEAPAAPSPRDARLEELDRRSDGGSGSYAFTTSRFAFDFSSPPSRLRSSTISSPADATDRPTGHHLESSDRKVLAKHSGKRRLSAWLLPLKKQQMKKKTKSRDMAQ